uniref:Zinc-finger protein n=3 Tax=Alloyangia mangrovi TaxID=1779329 RepID=A0A2A3JQG4_9RHOB
MRPGLRHLWGMTSKVHPMTDLSPERETERETWPAVWRGFRCRCPNCGNGPILRSYLKVRDHCPVCREELHHHRADDGPAYLTILIVGHIMAPALLWVFTTWRPEPLILITIFLIGCIGLSLYLLPRLKGAIVGFQWAREMHGFAREH